MDGPDGARQVPGEVSRTFDHQGLDPNTEDNGTGPAGSATFAYCTMQIAYGAAPLMPTSGRSAHIEGRRGDKHA